jgi:hypothetical protein
MNGPDFARVPCKGCGRPVIFVTAFRADGMASKVPLDPIAPVYSQQPDGEGGFIWVLIDKKQTPMFVSHFATCSKANDFSGRGQKGG